MGAVAARCRGAVPAGRGKAPAGHLDLPGGGLYVGPVAYGPESRSRAFECLSAGMGAPARTDVLGCYAAVKPVVVSVAKGVAVTVLRVASRRLAQCFARDVGVVDPGNLGVLELLCGFVGA